MQQREEQLRYQAFHDPLTGLANRLLFRDRLEHAAALRQREGRVLTVLFLDLDDFKLVNDRLGHAAGDALLVDVAERLRACLRQGDTVARLGGDEFAVLLEDGSEAQDRLAARIVDAMEVEFQLGPAPRSGQRQRGCRDRRRGRAARCGLRPPAALRGRGHVCREERRQGLRTSCTTRACR